MSSSCIIKGWQVRPEQQESLNAQKGVEEGGGGKMRGGTETTHKSGKGTTQQAVQLFHTKSHLRHKPCLAGWPGHEHLELIHQLLSYHTHLPGLGFSSPLSSANKRPTVLSISSCLHRKFPFKILSFSYAV